MPNDNVLLVPYVTEKSSKLMEDNQFVFILMSDNNKVTVRNYFEKKFDVKVDSVNVLKKPSKTVNRGRITGKKREYKKVIIKVNSGSNKDKIEQLF